MTFSVDVVRAGEIASAADDFAWTWEVVDVAAFCERIGWAAPVITPPASAKIRTDVAVGRAEAAVRFDRGKFSKISCYVTDIVAIGDEAVVVDAFAQLAQRVSDVLGTPTRRVPGEDPAVLWERPAVVVALVALSRSVKLELRDPRRQAEMDADARDFERSG